MATTIKEISSFLENRGIKHAIDEANNFVITGSPTANYHNHDGQKFITIVIKPVEQGEYIKVFAPKCYDYHPDSPHGSEVFQACLMISWFTKSIQYEYDINDGEIRCIIEFPLEDALLTEKQLMRCIHSIVQVTDLYDEMIRNAMNAGEIKPPEVDSPEELVEAFMEFMQYRERRQKQQSGNTWDELE